ncbi:MAG: LuxR family transcriptional regulator, partial [Eggerthella lenta]
MEKLRSAWDTALGTSLSLKRIAGAALQWLWMLMMFYSIVPYGFSSDVRGSLYVSLIISLVAMVVTMLFVSVIVRRERVSGNRSIVLGSAIMMSAGSVLTPFSDPTTPVGMLVLGLSAVMTGTGSAVLFLCWIELESGLGGRLALVELASSLCIAFVVGFLLIAGPAIPVIALVVIMPVLSAAALRRSAPDTPQLPREPEQPLSRHTATLFAKALLGAVLIGMLMGFFDV